MTFAAWSTAGEVVHPILGDVAVRPTPHLAAGQLSLADLQVVVEWIRLNQAAILDYWEGRIFTVELLQRLQKLP